MWNWATEFSLALGEDASLVFGEGGMEIVGSTESNAAFRIMMHIASKTEAPHIQLWIGENVSWMRLSSIL